ncbi:hypothetical protein HPL003_14155 [Paenibacillus terrae HPL-003]|uniref:DUF1878 domain-containing protein n=1 Tax=Paenibacillus terrae (strain HPL-003) TaxID=985665 RepID=G7W0G1_PAETH|nr:hypothetical protein [Paenibacillus terrae]AET59582.1 hypothetical protein HPL003_14155 [Paenibacillus terrae HPL-003]
MSSKSLEERVELLEYYNVLMRDFAVDPETYVLWDYIMSEHLNGAQGNQLLEVLKNHYTKLKIALEKEERLPGTSYLYEDLINVVKSFGKPASERTAYSILLRASKLPEFHLYSKYL